MCVQQSQHVNSGGQIPGELVYYMGARILDGWSVSLLKDKKLKKQQQDAVSNQVMLIFVAAAVLLSGVSFLYRTIDVGRTYGVGMMIARVLCIVSAAAAAGAFVWYFAARRQGKISPFAAFHPGTLALFLASLAVCCALLLFNPVLGMRLIYVLVPCLAILFLVFKVYERQFFTMCVVVGYTVFAMYLCYKLTGTDSIRMAGFLSAAVLCLIPPVLSFLPHEHVLRLALLGREGARRLQIPLYLAVLLCLFAAFWFGGKAALVLLLCGVAYLVGAAIYFTVRLI